ncbi:MAG TPA: DUF1993 domain-containing protein [Dongiaceae bacterium]|jgi:hypothetical protein|nr:DUF1993 domain-containing protein [Dongiaceae bacterium]
MSVSLYHASVPVFRQMLGALSSIMDKAAAHAEARKIDPSVFVNGRLFPDMFPFTRQVTIAADFAKGASARLAGIEVPKFEDTETTFPELKARIRKTLDFLATLKPAQFEGAEARDVTIPLRGEPTTFKGGAYLFHFAMPNFYFHATTAYDILRHLGVEIGKSDFIHQLIKE